MKGQCDAHSGPFSWGRKDIVPAGLAILDSIEHGKMKMNCQGIRLNIS